MYQMAHMGNFLMHDQLIVIFSMSSPSNTAGILTNNMLDFSSLI